jgi:hypothetical protein
MPHVEINRQLLSALAYTLARNRPRHNIARRKLKQSMIPVHKAVAPRIPQISAFAAQRF